MSTIHRDMDIVSSLRLSIASAIGDDRFDLWFGRTEILVKGPADGRVVIVKAPCEFSVQWIRNNFRDAIQAACKQVLDLPVEIRFEMRTDSPEAIQDLLPAPPESSVHACTKAESPTTAAKASDLNHSGIRGQRRFASLASFVASHSNQVAVATAQAVAAGLGRFNPLFFCGPHGAGKTHLLEGIWSAVRGQQRRRCVYLTSEQFTTFFLQALHGGGLPSFRRRYRDLDLLVIDDIQFLEGKRATVNELVHTMDAVMRDGNQLVLSANCPVSQLASLSSDIVHRLRGGLVMELTPPSLEDRITILQRACRQRNLQVAEDVITLIARNIPHDVRGMMGALNRLEVYQLAHEEPITESPARQYLQDIIQAQTANVHLRDIERAVCNKFELEPNDLRSPDRSRKLANIRMLAMWLARKHTGAALSEIGDYFGRSHSTVVSAEKRVKEWLKSESTIRSGKGDCRVPDAIRDLENRLRTG